MSVSERVSVLTVPLASVILVVSNAIHFGNKAWFMQRKDFYCVNTWTMPTLTALKTCWTAAIKKVLQPFCFDFWWNKQKLRDMFNQSNNMVFASFKRFHYRQPAFHVFFLVLYDMMLCPKQKKREIYTNLHPGFISVHFFYIL